MQYSAGSTLHHQLELKLLWCSSALSALQEEAPSEEDGRAGKMVVYMTSLQAVRETHDLCHRVVQVLRGHGVSLTLKDVFLHPDYAKELSERIGAEGAVLPQVGAMTTTITRVHTHTHT